MSRKLQLSFAVGDYDRTRALADGSVQVDGVEPVVMTLSPEEMFFRAFRSVDFDVSELSFSSYLVKTAQGDCPYVAIPVFLSRAGARADGSPGSRSSHTTSCHKAWELAVVGWILLATSTAEGLRLKREQRAREARATCWPGRSSAPQ